MTEIVHELDLFYGFKSIDLLPKVNLIKTPIGNPQQTLIDKNSLNHLIFSNETDSRKVS